MKLKTRFNRITLFAYSAILAIAILLYYALTHVFLNIVDVDLFRIFSLIILSVTAFTLIAAFAINRLIFKRIIIYENKLISLDNFDLSVLILDVVKKFEKELKEKDIQVKLILEEKSVCMNKALTEIMLDNLIFNAIKYNVPLGKLEIYINKEELIISNSGGNKPLDESVIFNQFNNGDISGICQGLAISKQICAAHYLTLAYQFRDSLHQFSIS